MVAGLEFYEFVEQLDVVCFVSWSEGVKWANAPTIFLPSADKIACHNYVYSCLELSVSTLVRLLLWCDQNICQHYFVHNKQRIAVNYAR